VTPSGDVSLTPGKATLTSLEKGSQVIPHKESMSMLAMAGIARVGKSDRQADNLTARKIDELKSVIKNKPTHILQGRVVGSQVGGTRQKYLDSLRNR
jgi:phage-related tail protein